MNFIRLLVLIIFCGVHVNVYAAGDDDSNFDWMNMNILSMTRSTIPCIEVPQLASMTNANHSLNLDESGEWRSANVYVEEDKLLQIEWSAKGVLPRPDKYKVLYRIDPRFEKPQVFIQRYDYKQDKYISDFHQFKGGQLLRYQGTPEMLYPQRVDDFVDYFNFKGRSKIPVKKDDVINITLDNTSSFFGSKSEMNAELGVLDNLLMIYTQSSLPDNRLIYSNTSQWCRDAITNDNSAEYFMYCMGAHFGMYWDVGVNWKTLQGRIDNASFNMNKSTINKCPDSANGKDNNPLCYYDKGRGMVIGVGGTAFKDVTEKFVHSNFSGKDFLYHKSDVEGELDFISYWPIDGMYNNSPLQYMKSWKGFATLHLFDIFMAPLKSKLTMNFLYFGRYLMDIEIGNSLATIPVEDIQAIEVEYIIMESGTPTASTSGTSIEQDFRGNADKSGVLWLRVNRPNDLMTGTIQVKTANYTGSTWFSDVVYDELVKPIREKFNELSKTIYHKLISNIALQNIARSMMVVYIIIYGLMFLAGAVQITVTDIVTRVLKIGVIVALFSETSWLFFSTYLFNVFVDGADYLMSTIIGIASKTGNVFAFIDPIFDKYTNKTIWGLLFIQLLQIHNGVAFFAILTIFAILIFFKATIEVVVTYILAFLSLAVMISLAPFFIILILFERTKNMFDNWISTMFSFMMQPTLLLIFFLMIDQIMGDHIARTVVSACWGILIPIEIGLDLNNLGIPISFSFTLPFLPGIPFFVPEIQPINTMEDFFLKPGTFSMIATSALLFYTLSKLAEGLVEYVSLVGSYLTKVTAARRDGNLQKRANPVQNIISDMNKLASPVTGTAKGVRNFVKRKVVDQKISNNSRKLDSQKASVGDIDYSKIDKSKWKTAVPNEGSGQKSGIKIGSSGGRDSGENRSSANLSTGGSSQSNQGGGSNQPNVTPNDPRKRGSNNARGRRITKPPTGSGTSTGNQQSSGQSENQGSQMSNQSHSNSSERNGNEVNSEQRRNQSSSSESDNSQQAKKVERRDSRKLRGDGNDD